MALEGKELEGKFAGSDGSYSADISDRGMATGDVSYSRKVSEYFKIRGSLGMDLDLVAAIQALAAKKPESKLLKSIADGVARVASRLPPPPAI